MFTEFFYTLRRQGVPISLTEWITLQEALATGLNGTSLTSFYFLARAVLVKTETQYDRFDLAFQEYFEGIETDEKLLEQLEEWLANSLPARAFSKEEREQLLKELGFPDWDALREALEERLRTQKGPHHGGGRWIGTRGTAQFGNSGFNLGGVRLGGEFYALSAVKVAGERRYKAYRSDITLGVRQFEAALRRLRHFTTRIEGPKSELDLAATIDSTCGNGGHLKLEWTRPRQNTVKLLVLMDVGGSMSPYAKLCSRLFSAVHKMSHFKKLKFYYFHNCIYEYLFHDSNCDPDRSDNTEQILNTLASDHKIIIIGDAVMASSELLMRGGNIFWDLANERPGIAWLEQIAKQFHYSVWLNPIPQERWKTIYGHQTLTKIREVFPMYELTLDGIEQAMKRLMARK